MSQRPFVLAAVMAAASLIGTVAHAQGSLAGSWRAVLNINGTMVEFDMVVQPNMAFSETQKSNGGMTMQTGQVQQTGPDTVTFVVEDWEPKTMPSYSFAPQCPGQPCWHQIPTTKPPGGTWRYWFNGPNSLGMHDVYMGGDITYQRVG